MQATLMALLGLSSLFAAYRTGGTILGGLLAWLGLCFIAVAIAYQRRAPGIFGKRPDGRLSLTHKVLLFPYLAYTSGVWQLVRLLSREPVCQEITPSLFVSRRLLSHEVPEGLSHIVDLTAEFDESPRAREHPGFIAFPILDASTPTVDQLREFLPRADGPGPTLIHCAQGHGRTGLVSIAYLLHRGEAASVDEALRLLQSVRPGLRLNRKQLAWIRATESEWLPATK